MYQMTFEFLMDNNIVVGSVCVIVLYYRIVGWMYGWMVYTNLISAHILSKQQANNIQQQQWNVNGETES
ncbi:hypothetical protein DERF_006025 [Dermatophagoides farinae]|uniref:Uncharacterized protein n=1 Tax=Dermatophagoides farinae TaxID=6954 RepID=A0A922I842_DERFA|nr:hypothetical protein DERF_006025 [Dermatophagoides farinae]